MEVEEGRRLALALMKQLTGGDNMTARMLYEEFEEFRPEHAMPAVSRQSAGPARCLRTDATDALPGGNVAHFEMGGTMPNALRTSGSAPEPP